MAEELVKETNCASYIECSAKNGIGITELLETIKEFALFPERADKKSKKKSSSKSGIFGRLKNVFQVKPNGNSPNSSPTIMESKQSSDNSTIIRLPMLSTPNVMPDVRTTPVIEEKQANSPSMSRDFNQVPFEDWTAEEVSKWLQSKGCNQTVIDSKYFT